jgi:hypothetical protein
MLAPDQREAWDAGPAKFFLHRKVLVLVLVWFCAAVRAHGGDSGQFLVVFNVSNINIVLYSPGALKEEAGKRSTRCRPIAQPPAPVAPLGLRWHCRTPGLPWEKRPPPHQEAGNVTSDHRNRKRLSLGAVEMDRRLTHRPNVAGRRRGDGK